MLLEQAQGVVGTLAVAAINVQGPVRRQFAEAVTELGQENEHRAIWVAFGELILIPHVEQEGSFRQRVPIRERQISTRMICGDKAGLV